MKIQSNLFLYILRHVIILLLFIPLLIWMLDVKKREIKPVFDPTFIPNLEVAAEDFRGPYWEIKEEAERLGNGWRIPTIEELQQMDSYKVNSMDSKEYYWSSDIDPNDSLKRLQYSFRYHKTRSVELNWELIKYQRIIEQGNGINSVRFVRTNTE